MLPADPPKWVGCLSTSQFECGFSPGKSSSRNSYETHLRTGLTPTTSPKGGRSQQSHRSSSLFVVIITRRVRVLTRCAEFSQLIPATSSCKGLRPGHLRGGACCLQAPEGAVFVNIHAYEWLSTSSWSWSF